MVSRRRRCLGGPQALIVGAGKGSIAVWNILPVITVVPASVRGLPDVGGAGCLQGVKRDPGVRQGRKGRVAARMSVRVGTFGRSVCIARGRRDLVRYPDCPDPGYQDFRRPCRPGFSVVSGD